MKGPNKETREFVQELKINAPKDAVWKALSDAAELTQWFAPQAKIQGPEGGSVTWQWTADIVWPQKIERWANSEQLLTVYDSEVDDGSGGKIPLFVDFQLQGNAGTTTLRLIHSGFGPGAEFDDEYDGISHGWVVELRSLQLYLEKHVGQRRQLSWVQADFDIDRQRAWQMLTGPEGLNCSTAIKNLKPGNRFSFTTPAGDHFEGEVFINDAEFFVGIVENWGNSFLRLQVDNCGGKEQVWLWHACYGQDHSKVDALAGNWKDMIEKLFDDESSIDRSNHRAVNA